MAEIMHKFLSKVQWKEAYDGRVRWTAAYRDE